MTTDTAPHTLNRHPDAWRDRAFYRFWTTEKVRFADIDALGHVNNNNYGVYFEIGRVALWNLLYKDNFWQRPQYGLLRAAHIEYHRELTYPNTIDIGVRILKIGTTSTEAVVSIFVGDVCNATSHTVGVMVEAKTHKPVAVSAEWREKALPYM